MIEYKIQRGLHRNKYYIHLTARENGVVVENKCQVLHYKNRQEREYVYTLLMSDARNVTVTGIKLINDDYIKALHYRFATEVLGCPSSLEDEDDD